jgi:ribonuclease E
MDAGQEAGEDASGTAEAGDGDAARTGGRRNRGRRGRGQAGEDRAAEDAAVLDGVPAAATRDETAGADEVADYRPEDTSEDLPPAAQTPVESNTMTIVPAPDGSSSEPVASEMAVLETGPVEPAVPEEIPATGRPRRRRAASRPAGPPV